MALGNQQQVDANLFSSQLLSYSLERLKKEPKLLSEENHRLQRQLQSTATTHYGAFIKTASCLQTIDTELHSVCGHLDHLLKVVVKTRHLCTCMQACTHACIHACTQHYTHVYSHTEKHTCEYIQWSYITCTLMRAHTHTHLHSSNCSNTYAHTYTHARTHPCTHAQTRMCSHMHAHTGTRARTHTHTHTHAHMW